MFMVITELNFYERAPWNFNLKKKKNEWEKKKKWVRSTHAVSLHPHRVFYVLMQALDNISKSCSNVWMIVDTNNDKFESSMFTVNMLLMLNFDTVRGKYVCWMCIKHLI